MIQLLEAEMSVIGSMLRDNAITLEIAGIVEERDFTTHFTRKAFSACITASNGIDALLLQTRMGAAQAEYIAQCVSLATTATAATEHARRVCHKAISNRFIDACSEAVIEAKDFDSEQPDDLLELISRHQNIILDVATKKAKDADFVSNTEGLKRAVDEIERRAKLYKQHGKDYLPGFKTGFSSIDSMIGGLQKQSQVVIGAHTGVGKTAMALNMASNAARNGAHVAILSHEMSTNEIFMRKIAAEGRIGASRLETGRLEKDDGIRIKNALSESLRDNMWVSESPPKTAPGVMQKCLQLKRRHGLDIVFVDYLQLMTGVKSSATQREQVVAEISRGLKQVAMDLDICVVALAQLNNTTDRASEPNLASLRESSAIAQNANAVLLLWEPASPNEKDQRTSNKPDDRLFYKVAKNRSGPQGQGELEFRKTIQLIREKQQ